MTQKKISSNTTLKHSTIYAVGNISRQLVGFLMLPIYTRFLTPADYGVIGLLSFAVILLEGALGARLTQAMPKYYYQETGEAQKNSVVSTALIITSLISLLTSLAIFIFRDAGSEALFGSTNYGLAVGVYGFQLLISAIEGYGLTYIRILQKPVLFISFSLCKLILQLSLNVWFIVYLKMGVMGVVYSGVLSTSLFAIVAGIYTLRQTGVRFNWPIGKKMLIFSWPLWFSGMAIFYVSASNRYFIRLFSSLDDVGLFELATKLSAILIMLIWTPFNQFWETERFKIYKDDANAPEKFQQAFVTISLIMAVAALGISSFSPIVIKIMADELFYKAYVAVPILMLGTLFGSLATFFNFSFLVKEATGFISKNNFIIAGVVTLLYLICVPAWGFIGAAIALSTTQILQFFWVYYSAKKLFDMKISLNSFLSLMAFSGGAGILIGCSEWSSSIVIDGLIRTALFMLAIIVIFFISPPARDLVAAACKYIRSKSFSLN